MPQIKSADPLGVSEGTLPPLMSFLTHYSYIGPENVAQRPIDYCLGDLPTVSKGGGTLVYAVKTDTPIKDSHYGLQKTIGFCNFCFTSAIGVSLFQHQFHNV